MIDDKLIESYILCNYKSYSILHNEEGNKNEYSLLLDKTLKQNRKKFFDSIHSMYGDELILDIDFKKKPRINIKAYAIDPKVNEHGYNISFDAMDISQSKTSSNLMYTPIFISPRETFSKSDKLLICIKALILLEVYSCFCQFGRIIYGSDSKTIKFKIENYLTEAKRMLRELKQLVQNREEPILFQKDHCKICEFQDKCKKKLADTDSLGRLRRMDETLIKRHNAKGIFTVNQLSYTFKPRKRNTRIKKEVLPYSHSLQALAIREQKIYVYDKINMPISKTRVFVDMEGDANGNFVYLIGLLIVTSDGEKKYSLWADNPEEEKEIFKKFVQILNELDDPHIFHFGKYESKVLKRLLKENQNVSVNNALLNKSTNILKVIYKAIYFPTYSNTLKELGNSLGFSWSSISNSIETIAFRSKWEENQDDKIKQLLIDYNYEDCIALQKVSKILFEINAKIHSEKENNISSNVAFVENLKISDNQKMYFKDMEYASKDIEIVTKSAYFEYQRNKVYWRTDNNIKKTIRRKKKQNKIILKVNKVVNMKALKCKYCNSREISAKENGLYQTTILNLKISNFSVKKWVVHYKTYSYECLNCMKRFIPKNYKKIQYYSRRESKARTYIKHSQIGYGHDLVSWVIHHYLVNKTTFRNMEGDLKYYFKIPLTHREIWEIKVIASECYEGTYRNILRKLIKGKLLHADESKVKLKKESGYIWAFTNMEEVYYLYRPNREADFLDDFLNGFSGILISDFYSGYDSLNCEKQKCLVHLIRDLNDLLLRNLHDEEIKNIVNSFGNLMRNIVETIDKYGLKKRFLKKHKKASNQFFNKLKKRKLLSEEAEKIQKRLLKYEKELFLFLDHDNIPWSNNNVEYAIKSFKDYLRQIKGTITQRGLEAHLILLSIQKTCEYKGINFLDFLLSGKKGIDEFEATLKN